MPDLTQERLRELSETAARWWVWMPGMRDQHGFRCTKDLGHVPGAHPDLSDPATAGLLPYVGRKVTGLLGLHTRPVVVAEMVVWILHGLAEPVPLPAAQTEVDAWVLGVDALVRAMEGGEG